MTPDGVTVRTVARKGGGKGGDKQSAHQPTEASNTLRSKSTARVLEVLSEGVVEGLATGDLQSVFLDKTPIMNPDGTTNFVVPESYFREGLPEQDPVPGFPAAEAEVGVGVELQYAVPVVRRLTPGLSAIRYKVRVNALYMQENDGDVSPTEVDYKMELRVGTGGAWVQMVAEQIFGKTMSPYERAVRVTLPVTDDIIDVRLTRTSPAPSDSTVQNTIFFSTYTEIIDVNLQFVDTALAATVVDSQYFPSVPLRGYLLRGIIVQVPTNYDPLALTYTGDWDGTFKTAWTKNPAWILYDLLTNQRYGIGRDIDAYAVDKWSLYECSLYNDERVPDGHGTGGTEPRFTCNCVINTRQDALIVLSAVASSMRAVLYYAAGTVFVVQDREQTTPERLFGPANVAGASFDYTGTDYRSLFTAVPVTWLDPADSYEPNVELVQDQDLVARQGYRPKDNNEVAFGCTSRGQAIRWGRWLIFTAQNETEFVSFRTGLENVDVRPGQLIAINDPSRAGVRLAGRTLEQPTPDQLQFDAPARGIAPGWQVYVTVGDTVTETTVLAVLAPDTVRVSGLAGAVPAASMWLAASNLIEPTPWRVITIKDNGGGVYEVLAAQYHPGKYAYVDFGVHIAAPPYTIIPTGPIVGPTNPSVREYIYLDGSGSPQFGVVLSWQASVDPRVSFYLVELEGPAADYRRYDDVAGVSVDVPRMRQGEWKLAIVAIDSIGRRSPPLRVTFNTVGLSAKPLPPPALYIQPQLDMLHLQWVQTTELDVSYWWIKWSKVVDGSAQWNQATTVAARIDRRTTTMNTPYRAGTYLIKAVDSLGQESDTATSAIVSPQDRATTTLVDIAEQPTWAGTLGPVWEIDAPELWLLPPPDPEPVPVGVYPGERGLVINSTPTRVGIYGFATALDLGVPAQINMTATVEARGTFASDDVMALWTPLASADPLARNSSGNWDAHIEAALSQDGATFAEWFVCRLATVTARAVKFRLVGSVYDLETTLKVFSAEVVIDAPKRTETGNDAIIGTDGTLAVAYAVPFAVTPNVQITAAELAAGGNLRVSASDRDGFTVEHRDASGALVVGASFDWFAQGYGVH